MSLLASLFAYRWHSLQYNSCNTRNVFITVLYTYIQGDSGGICTTLGNDSMSDSKQKSSYEHGSDFERLRSYGRLKFGIGGNDF